MPAGTTLETTPLELRPIDGGECSFLFVVLECDRPDAGGARFNLHRADEVIVGRGDSRSCCAEDRRLAISLPDNHVSRQHARLRREADRFRLEDLGSRNGCLLNGAPASNVTLEDGDVLQLGHTLLIFREGLPDAPHLDQPQPGAFATLLPELKRRFDELARVAASDVSIVLLGETGTGKEVLARHIHELSRRPGAFVALNCGGLPSGILQSELFGVKKGAFSGALEDRPGLLRAAEKGTLLLDEVGDLPQPEQAAFLRVLQEREVTPLGGTRPIHVDVRLLSATHRDPKSMIDTQEFRGDLWARISGFTVELPPLRERREDLGLFIAAELNRSHAKISISPDAGMALLRHEWPFNARELAKCIEAAIPRSELGRVGMKQLPPEVREAVHEEPRGPLPDRDQQQRELLVEALQRHGGNVSAVARSMNKARAQVHRWMKRYRIELQRK